MAKGASGLPPSNATCQIVSTPNGRILSGTGDLRTFLNVSLRALVGRDIYVFIDKERTAFQRSIAVLSPNIAVERDLTLRPRDRKPFLARVMITRNADDTTVQWDFSSIA